MLVFQSQFPVRGSQTDRLFGKEATGSKTAHCLCYPFSAPPQPKDVTSPAVTGSSSTGNPTNKEPPGSNPGSNPHPSQVSWLQSHYFGVHLHSPVCAVLCFHKPLNMSFSLSLVLFSDPSIHMFTCSCCPLLYLCTWELLLYCDSHVHTYFKTATEP